jgi:hypothetical protein
MTGGGGGSDLTVGRGSLKRERPARTPARRRAGINAIFSKLVVG